MRQHVIAAARRAGLEPQLRRLQEHIGPAERRRDLRDNRHMALLFAWMLGSHDNCVDVGASTGDLLAHMVRLAPHGHHVAFEPLPELGVALKARFPRVDVRVCAVGDRGGQRPFYRDLEWHWQSSLSPLGRPARRLQPLDVEVCRLDDALPEGYAPSLIKIDVEGAEGAVLTGALETLRRHRPHVVFEHGHQAQHFSVGSTDVHRLLTLEAGLRVFDIEGGGPYEEAEFLRRIERGDLWTFVAHA